MDGLRRSWRSAWVGSGPSGGLWGGSVVLFRGVGAFFEVLEVLRRPVRVPLRRRISAAPQPLGARRLRSASAVRHLHLAVAVVALAVLDHQLGGVDAVLGASAAAARADPRSTGCRQSRPRASGRPPSRLRPQRSRRPSSSSLAEPCRRSTHSTSTRAARRRAPSSPPGPPSPPMPTRRRRRLLRLASAPGRANRRAVRHRGVAVGLEHEAGAAVGAPRRLTEPSLLSGADERGEARNDHVDRQPLFAGGRRGRSTTSCSAAGSVRTRRAPRVLRTSRKAASSSTASARAARPPSDRSASSWRLTRAAPAWARRAWASQRPRSRLTRVPPGSRSTLKAQPAARPGIRPSTRAVCPPPPGRTPRRVVAAARHQLPPRRGLAAARQVAPLDHQRA